MKEIEEQHQGQYERFEIPSNQQENDEGYDTTQRRIPLPAAPAWNKSKSANEFNERRRPETDSMNLPSWMMSMTTVLMRITLRMNVCRLNLTSGSMFFFSLGWSVLKLARSCRRNHSLVNEQLDNRLINQMLRSSR